MPYPRIMGAVGIKLSVISKYKIKEATRHQLGLMPYDVLSRQFRFKRAVLEVRLPVRDGKDFVVLNTHLEAFTHLTDILERQVAQIKAILDGLTRDGFQWIIGGDFNLLPPGPAYTLLPKGQQAYYHEKTEIEPLFDAFQAVPSLEETNGPDRALWFTHFPNNPAVKGPDRTIDYFFMPGSSALIEHHVRRDDTLRISDHFPVVATVKLP